MSDVGKSLPSITSPNVPVEGTKEADELIGKDADDTISGKEGNDTIDGRAGDDSIDGGTGDDTVIAGEGNDMVSLGDGDDVLNIFNLGDVAEYHGVDDTIDGGAGNDKIYELSGADSIIGGDGNDTIGTVDLHKSTTSDAENAHDTVEAGDGDDVLIADRGDILTGGKGKDSFKIVVYSGGDGVTKITDYEKGDTIKLWRQAPEGGSFSAVITTNESGGNTEIRVDGVRVAIVEGATGLNVNDIETETYVEKEDTLGLEKGPDNLSNGTSANDSLTGTDKNDVMSGFGGDDAISAGAGDDTVSGGAGNDTIFADTADTIEAGDGQDDINIVIGKNETNDPTKAQVIDYKAGEDKITL